MIIAQVLLRRGSRFTGCYWAQGLPGNASSLRNRALGMSGSSDCTGNERCKANGAITSLDDEMRVWASDYATLISLKKPSLHVNHT